MPSSQTQTSLALVAGFRPASSACGTATASDTFWPPSTGRAVKRHSLNDAAAPDALACTVFGPSACTAVSLGATRPTGGGGLPWAVVGGGGLRCAVLGRGGLRLMVGLNGGGLRLTAGRGGGGLGRGTRPGGGGRSWGSGGGGDAATGSTGRSPTRDSQMAAPAKASSRVPSCRACWPLAPAAYR